MTTFYQKSPPNTIGKWGVIGQRQGYQPAALNTEIERRHGDTEIILEVCFTQ